jgi:hypothetical protein
MRVEPIDGMLSEMKSLKAVSFATEPWIVCGRVCTRLRGCSVLTLEEGAIGTDQSGSSHFPIRQWRQERWRRHRT